MNQKYIRKQCEQIWARNKYYVLSKSHKVYLEIREYLKESEVDYKRQSKNVQKWEFKNVQFYSLNISFKR